MTSAIAQGAPGGARPYKLPPNLLEYFKGKYVHVDDRLIARLQETPDGPLGQISVYGKISPQADVRGMAPEERARAVALAFIAEEAALFDIANFAEIRELSFKMDGAGKSSIYYVRYIGRLQLVGQLFRIEVANEGVITHAHATLTPVPSELYGAVDRKTITKEVMRIVERDLTRPGQKTAPTIAEPELSATWRPPYVVWGAGGAFAGKPAWAYVINAFTGEITNKTCTAETGRYVPGESPCD